LFKKRIVQLNEIPEIRSFLKEMTNDDIFAKSSTIKGAIFDQNNIIEVIDTLDYVNYSFRFVFPETPLGTFYNLVVTKTPTGE
ncbi:MAG TPA: hypothetical protein DDZ39_02085, partial [Flavobacteriaceae bacterium]|nr:hypothetical protein [Flavobacteriaceae bacterium]